MFEIDREKLGTFISMLRKEKGLTQKELAQMLHISDKAVSKWETAHSIPDVNMLVPLAEVLGVSVTELLECRRMEIPERMDTDATDNLVKKVIELSEEQNPQNKKKNMQIYFILLGISIIEMIGFAALESIGAIQSANFTLSLFIVIPIAMMMGAYFWIFVKEKLPSYYDENEISVYTNGFFSISMPGLCFNNNNWGHIVKVLRIWSVLGMVGYPWFQLFIDKCIKLVMGVLPISVDTDMFWLNHFLNLFLILGFVLGGMFIPAYAVGKKYQYGEETEPNEKKKANKRWHWVWRIVLILIIVIISSVSTFGMVSSGNRIMYVSGEGRSHWKADYKYFDGYTRRSLWVDEDGFLDVTTNTEEGKISVEITDGTGNVILKKADMGNSEYHLPASGKVKVIIQAEKHRGGFEIK